MLHVHNIKLHMFLLPAASCRMREGWIKYYILREFQDPGSDLHQFFTLLLNKAPAGAKPPSDLKPNVGSMPNTGSKSPVSLKQNADSKPLAGLKSSAVSKSPAGLKSNAVPKSPVNNSKQ